MFMNCCWLVKQFDKCYGYQDYSVFEKTFLKCCQWIIPVSHNDKEVQLGMTSLLWLEKGAVRTSSHVISVICLSPGCLCLMGLVCDWGCFVV